jgi:arsenate reductase
MLVGYTDEPFDSVITLCGSANESCPVFFSGVQRVHIGFDDPSRSVGSHDDMMQDFRRVRDVLKEKLIAFLTGAIP